MTSLGKGILVLAIGGNAVASKSRAFQSQLDAIWSIAKRIAKLKESGYKVVITHGNGPQVGDGLLRHESARDLVPPLPLYACVAETQGLLGFMIQSSLSSHLGRDDVVSLISIAYVSKNDPAFRKPNKPIGPVYSEDALKEARRLNRGSEFLKVSSNGYRRVVASPDPVAISGSAAVRDLLRSSYVVIAAGGGGIPAIRNGTRISFVDAVVDKDLASERLATSIGASKLIILTDVEGAYLDYSGKRMLLKNVTANEMRSHLEKGEFGEGSMAPKVRAAIRFAENTGNSTTICSLDKIGSALGGRAGTTVGK